MRARRGLGVILDRKHRAIDRGQSFDRMIVQTQMSYQNLTERCIDDRRSFRYRADRAVHRYSEIVVLRGDLDPSRAEVHDRMVGAMMAELQLIGAEPQRKTK